MRIDRGFRIPEPSDKAIQWPGRTNGGDPDPTIAIYRPAIRAWSIPGVERAFGAADEMVRIYGNDWYVLWVERAAEAEK